MVDLGNKLKRLRRERGLSQRDAARQTGLGIKTISSFETGERIESMKLCQLQRLLEVYGTSEAEFFADVRRPSFMEDHGPDRRLVSLVRRVGTMPIAVQDALLARFQLIVDTADEIQLLSQPRPYAGEHRDWQLLTSHN